MVFGTYNRAELLVRSLEGHLRQRPPLDRMEIIAIDDWSTDDVLATYARRMPIVAVRPPWKEPCKAYYLSADRARSVRARSRRTDYRTQRNPP